MGSKKVKLGDAYQEYIDAVKARDNAERVALMRQKW